MSNGEGRGKQPTPTLDQKISRLPKPTRDMINLMLDDGLPYKVIIDELAQSGRGLTPQSLIQWLQSGYADYLKHRDEIEAVKTRAEFAADFLRELGDIDVTTIHRACLLLASLQIFNAIDEHGEKALREMLQIKPASYCTLLNSLCTTVKPVIALEKHCVASESNAK